MHFISKNSNKFDAGILLLIFISVIFVPSIKITNEFYLGLEEGLLLLAFLRLIFLKSISLDLYLKVLVAFIFYIAFTILYNGNLLHFREYFECYKVLKFIILVKYTIVVFNFSKINYTTIIKSSFLIILIFNFLHYFNVFHFNHLIFLFYDIDQRDILEFGVNSIGQPAAKRMIGTMGNPNVNSMLFLFYLAFFVYEKIRNGFKTIYQDFYLISSVICIVLCQSRTGIVIMLLILLIYAFFTYKEYKRLIIQGFSILLLLFLIFQVDKQSYTYVSNFKFQTEKNTSLKGRLEVWNLLGNQILEKPIFGRGPNKEYLYANKIYPENEYIFMTWRFGFLGLLFYLFWIIYPVLYFGKKMKLKNNLYFYISLIILISALSNNPITESRIVVLIGIIIGIGFAESLNRMKKNDRVG